MMLRAALERLAVLDNTERGWNFHYTSCGIYFTHIFTVRKAPDDPTNKCTCGRDEAIRTVLESSVGANLAAEYEKWKKDGGAL